jgi:hypothetical protein
LRDRSSLSVVQSFDYYNAGFFAMTFIVAVRYTGYG